MFLRRSRRRGKEGERVYSHGGDVCDQVSPAGEGTGNIEGLLQLLIERLADKYKI